MSKARPQISLEDFITGFTPAGGTPAPVSRGSAADLPKSLPLLPKSPVIPLSQNFLMDSAADPVSLAHGTLNNFLGANIRGSTGGNFDPSRGSYEPLNSGSKIADALDGLGRVMNFGSGNEGALGGIGPLAARALGDLPDASSAMGTLGGVNARYAPREELRDFVAMKRHANPNDQAQTQALWESFGWDVPGPDGKPKWEIPDTNAKLRWWDDLKNLQASTDDGRLELNANFVDWLEHDPLFANYPGLADLRVSMTKGVDRLPHTTEGSYTHGWKDRAGVYHPPQIGITYGQYDEPQDIISALLHEGAGHGVQSIEGDFLRTTANRSDQGNAPVIAQRIKGAGGKDPDASTQAWIIYQALKNEVGARNIQHRFLNPDQTMNLAPSLTQDHPAQFQLNSYDWADPRKGLPSALRVQPNDAPNWQQIVSEVFNVDGRRP